MGQRCLRSHQPLRQPSLPHERDRLACLAEGSNRQGLPQGDIFNPSKLGLRQCQCHASATLSRNWGSVICSYFERLLRTPWRNFSIFDSSMLFTRSPPCHFYVKESRRIRATRTTRQRLHSRVHCHAATAMARFGHVASSASKRSQRPSGAAFGGRVPLDEILQELKNTWKQVQVPGFDPGGDEQRHEPQRYLPSAAGSSRNESTVHDQVCASHVG